jgi:hypothetical protein
MRRSYVVPMRWMVIYEVPGGALTCSTKLPSSWSPWESSPSRKNPHGRAGNRTQDLIISSQKLGPLDHEAAPQHEYDSSEKRVLLKKINGTSSRVHLQNNSFKQSTTEHCMTVPSSFLFTQTTMTKHVHQPGHDVFFRSTAIAVF